MSSFTENIIAEIQSKPDELQLLLERMGTEKNIGIWGTGVAGKTIFNTAKSLGVNISFFVDGTKDVGHNATLLGTPVISPRQIAPDAYIIIAANVSYGIHLQLEKQGINTYCYIDPLVFSQYTKNKKESVINEISASQFVIDSVYDRLSDDLSRKTFSNVIIHRANHQLKLLWDVFEPKQYFGNDLVKSVSGCFVDCGAFTGDTLKAFLSQVKDSYYMYYAFEPELNNYNALKDFVEENHLSSVKIFPIGLWDRKAYLQFKENETNDTLAWKLEVGDRETDSSIMVDSIDNVLQGAKVDFIKMDIEGSELKALDGAKECIKKYKPLMAISAYHELNHIWNVPQKMIEINPSAKLYYRHHSWNMADTVCYGI